MSQDVFLSGTHSETMSYNTLRGLGAYQLLSFRVYLLSMAKILVCTWFDDEMEFSCLPSVAGFQPSTVSGCYHLKF